MNQFLSAEIFGMTWWVLLLWIAYFAYTARATWVLIDESHVYIKKHHTRIEVIRFRTGLRETFFNDDDYFRLWDIFRMVAAAPSIILALSLLLLKQGIWQFLPMLRHIFGFKLFKLKKEIKD